MVYSIGNETGACSLLCNSKDDFVEIFLFARAHKCGKSFLFLALSAYSGFHHHRRRRIGGRKITMLAKINRK